MQELRYKPRFPQPLSYIGMRFIIIAFIIIAQLTTVVLCYEAVFEPANLVNDLASLENTISISSTLSTSLVCVTTFSIVYRKSNSPIKALIFYAVTAIIFYFVEIFFGFMIGQWLAEDLLKELIGEDLAQGTSVMLIYFVITKFGNLNVFIDLFFCIILYFSIIYTPKKIKAMEEGRKKTIALVLYRMLVILPIAYVVISINPPAELEANIFVTTLLATNKIQSYEFFLLTCIGFKIYTKVCNVEKPSAQHLSFIMIAALIIVSIIEGILHFVPGAGSYGFGKQYFIILGIPFVLIYNYQTKTKHDWTIIFVFILQGALYAFVALFYLGLYLEIVEALNGLKDAFLQPEETTTTLCSINYLINNFLMFT